MTYSDEGIPHFSGPINVKCKSGNHLSTHHLQPTCSCHTTKNKTHNQLNHHHLYQINADVSTHIERVPDTLQRAERDDLLEEVEEVVAGRRVWEEGDGRGARPRDDGDEDDAEQDRAADAVEHQEDCQDAAIVMRG